MKTVFNKPRLFISVIILLLSILFFSIFFLSNNLFIYTLSFCLLGLAFSAFTASQDGDPNYSEETILSIILGYIKFVITAILVSIFVTELLLRFHIGRNEFYYSSAFLSLYLMLHIDFLTARLLLIFKK